MRTQPTLPQDAPAPDDGGVAGPGVLDRDFLDLVVRSERIFWAGRYPPLGRLTCSEAIYDAERDFRLPATSHRRFDLVMLVERDLGGIKAWPVVLDEALRLLVPGGTLLLRYSQTTLLTVFALKHFLHVRTGGRIAPVLEQVHVDGTFQSAFRVDAGLPEPAELESFSFAVITDGRRPASLDAFVESVRRLTALDPMRREILICGPEAELRRFRGHDDVTPVPEPESFGMAGWITRKKNLLVEASRFTNLVLAHDRYTLPPDFVQQLRGFGADFDVLMCRQQTPDGQRSPDLVTLGSEWSWTSGGLLEYGDHCRYLYVNGGIIIAKREVLRRTPWNELLFWMQAEDVELTRRLQHQGVVPRMARDVLVVTEPTRRGFVEGFENLPRVDDRFLTTGPARNRGEEVAPDYVPGTRVPLAPGVEVCLRRGLRLTGGWRFEALHAAWDGAVAAEIFLRTGTMPAGDLEAVLGLRGPGGVAEIHVNGQALPAWRDVEGRLRVTVPAALVAREGMLRLTFLPGSRRAAPLRVVSMEVRRTESAEALREGQPLRFEVGQAGVAALGSGWWAPESWGAWSIGTESTLSVELGFVPVGDLLLVVEADIFAAPGSVGRIVGVTVNDTPAGWLRMAHGTERYSLLLPGTVAGEGRHLRIVFNLQDVGTPASLLIGEDVRPLGIGLRGLTLHDAR